MATRERPISPFFTYRWQYTNTLSILNRLTGLALSIGLIPLIYWLVAAASGPEAYADALEVLGSPIVMFIMVGFSFSFFYHLLNGIRHLVWDLGYGFDLRVARASGWTVFIGSLVLTALSWALLAHAMGGAA
ncbi:MAG: succinate dehydrogenase, cytochrome b556 subunit [Steroidobacteraceae bacterium]